MTAMSSPQEDREEATRRGARQAEVAAALSQVLPATAILVRREDTTPYECDGLTAFKAKPMVVVLPENETQLAGALKVCHRLGVPVVARGAGTGLSGGAMPHRLGRDAVAGEVRPILKVDALSRTAASSAVCAISRSARPPRLTACTTPPIQSARSPAPSAATWPRIPAACTASNTA